MAAHSSILAWKIPWTAEPGRLPSMGSQRVGHDWATSLWLSLSSRRCLCDQARKISGCWIFSGLLQKQKRCTHTLLYGLCWEKRGAVGSPVRGWAHQAACVWAPQALCLFPLWPGCASSEAWHQCNHRHASFHCTLSHCASLYCTLHIVQVLKTNWRFVANPCQASPLVPFSQ